jgi:hypothetical protein
MGGLEIYYLLPFAVVYLTADVCRLAILADGFKADPGWDTCRQVAAFGQELYIGVFRAV